MKNLTRTAVRLDRALFRAVFRVKWEPLDRVMRIFTVAGTAGAMWGAVAFAAFVATGLSPWNLILPWTAIAASWLVAEGSKHFFDRSRPFIYDAGIAPLIKTPSSSSFPSGHSATAAAGAVTLSFLYPALAAPLVFAGFLVVLSRVYLGVHYPFDVAAGTIIGVLAAAFGILAFP
jgi:undecaprenyl-diphosphatase